MGDFDTLPQPSNYMTLGKSVLVSFLSKRMCRHIRYVDTNLTGTVVGLTERHVICIQKQQKMIIENKDYFIYLVPISFVHFSTSSVYLVR